MKDFIEWSDTLSVGVDEIDEQHKGLAAMVNEMSVAIEGGWGKEARDQILVRLIEYTRVHFATEESLMSISSYAGLKAHKKQHENLIEIVKSYIKKYNEDPNASSYDLLFFLKKWLVDHIMKDDKAMGDYLVKVGAAKTKSKARKSLLGWLGSLFGFGNRG